MTRRSFWAWGNEDRQPTPADYDTMARRIYERYGATLTPPTPPTNADLNLRPPAHPAPSPRSPSSAPPTTTTAPPTPMAAASATASAASTATSLTRPTLSPIPALKPSW